MICSSDLQYNRCSAHVLSSQCSSVCCTFISCIDVFVVVFPLPQLYLRHHTPKLIAPKASLRKGRAWAQTSVFSVQRLLYFMRGARFLPFNTLCDTDGLHTGLLELYQTHTNIHHITQCLKHLTGIKPSTQACRDFPACHFLTAVFCWIHFLIILSFFPFFGINWSFCNCCDFSYIKKKIVSWVSVNQE